MGCKAQSGLVQLNDKLSLPDNSPHTFHHANLVGHLAAASVKFTGHFVVQQSLLATVLSSAGVVRAGTPKCAAALVGPDTGRKRLAHVAGELSGA